MMFHKVIGLLFYISVNCGTGFYIQPDVVFLSEHPRSQLIVPDSSFSLSCAIQLRGLRAEEGNLGVPIVQWSINETNVPTVFPDAVVSQTLSPSHLLRSTLTIPHSSHNHRGTYHCSVIDGTNEAETLTERLFGLCELQCFPFITVSNPATITVLRNSTSETVVLYTCSSVVLECGSLLPSQGLRPLLQWEWNGTTLDESSNSYHVLNSGDLALYHSHEGDMIGTFRCIAISGNSSVILANYTVVEGDHPNSPSLRLAVSPSSQVVEDDTFSILLMSSGSCLRNNTQTCVWTRNGSHICPESSGEILEVQSESRYSCEDHVLTISSASNSLHSGLYCCQIESDVGLVNETLCVDVQVVGRVTPLLISPHNGTTLTTNTSHNAQFTLSCTATQPYVSQYWLYNGVRILEDGGPLVVSANLSSVGVYQCFAGNEFEYSVAALRILPERFTNPPGQPTFVEIPRPDKEHRGAYFFSWQPPSYPLHLHLSNDAIYSLQPTSEQQPKENFVEIFISHASYFLLAVSLIDEESGDQLSEKTVSNFQTFNSKCRRYVYFPPLLSADCIRGQASVAWINNPDNVDSYPKRVYSEYGPVPGKYYINITCSLLNDVVLKTAGVFTEEDSTVFEDELPAGAHCVFSGAATPANGPAKCLDPAAIFYKENTSCQIATFVEFENSTYVVNEGAGYQQICLNSSGYDFYANLSATYHVDDNFTEVTEVFVDSAGSAVCVNVSLRNDATVNEAIARTIFLTLGSDSDLVFAGPPAIITVFDDDVVIVGFTERYYEMVAGQLKEVCVSAEGELERTVSLNMSVIEQHGTAANFVELDREEITFDSSHYEACVILNASSAITRTTLVVLTLIVPDEEGAIALSIGTANVTISEPAPITTAAIVVLVIVLLLIAVVICVVSSVEFKNSTYVVNEGAGYQQVCLNSSGYDFYANFSATYRDNDNFTEVTEVFVDSAGSAVCVNVSLRNDATVNEAIARTIFLTLGSDNDLVFAGPPAIITVFDDDVVIVGFTERYYEMVAGQLKEVCVSAEGELERTVSLNMSVMEQHGTAANFVGLDEEEITFDSSHYEACVILYASSAITQTTLVVLTLIVPDEEGAIALSIGTANVTISPPKEPGYEASAPVTTAVIVVVVIVLLLIAVVICVVCVLVLGWRNTRDTKIDVTKTLFTETSTQLKEYMLKPQQFKFGSRYTICEDLYMESTNAVFDVSDSVLERGVSTNAELKLPERYFEQEKSTNEVSEAPELKKESSSSQHSSTTSSSNPEYITSESLLLYSSPPSVGSNYPIPPAKVTDDNTTTHINFGESGIDSGVSGTSSGISGMNCNTVNMNKDQMCMGSSNTFGGSMNLLSDSELSSLFHPFGDSGIGMDS